MSLFAVWCKLWTYHFSVNEMSNICLLGSWPLIKAAALLNQSLLRDLPIVPITALTSSMLGSPQPPLLRPHLLPLLPLLFHTPSAVLSSSLWARPKKPAEQLPSQDLSSQKLIQTAGTLWPIRGASILKQWGEMEMVPPAIYSLPQFGFSGSLTAHPGNNYLCMLWLLSVWS